MTTFLATPFHARTAERNIANAWVDRNGFTVPAYYGDAAQEALAARVSAIIADISPREDVRVSGTGAEALLSAALAQNIGALVADASAPVQWRADGGALRGLGTLHRFGPADFLLRGFDADLAWFAAAAPRFEAAVREASAERGLLLIAGPFALPVLAAAGLEQAALLEPGHHAVCDWQGLTVTLFRRGGHAYQLACGNADGAVVFDRLMKRGPLFGLRLAGETALDVLRLERGLALPGVDWQPARAPFAAEPKQIAFRGVVLDSDEPAPFAGVVHDGRKAGRTLRSAYSPALKRAIALADIADIAPGAIVSVRHIQGGETREIAARVVALPFL